MQWHLKAKCRAYPSHLDDFFPDRFDIAASKRARSFCLGEDGSSPCPVLEICKAWGLEYERQGIWGGTTDEERNKLLGGGRNRPHSMWKTQRRRKKTR